MQAESLSSLSVSGRCGAFAVFNSPELPLPPEVAFLRQPLAVPVLTPQLHDDLVIGRLHPKAVLKPSCHQLETLSSLQSFEANG